MVRMKKAEIKKPAGARPLRTWIVIALIAVLTLICFRNVLAPSRMIYGSDQLIAGYMFKSFAKDFIATHQGFPMWNPYLFGGLPYLDAFHGDVFYYTMLLRLVFPVHSVMALIFILQVFLAGIGMYLFLRSFRINPYGSLIVAVGYMFTGALVSTTYAGHDGKAIIVSFLPWVFFFLNKGFDTKQFLYFALGGAVIGACLLSPHVQMTYYLLMAAFCYFAFRLAFLCFDERKLKPALKVSAYFIAMVGLGFLISAVQFLPGIAYLQFSPRGGIGRGYSFATSWSMPALELFDLITPHFSGLLDNYWGTNYFKQHTEYLGILPLILAGIAVAYRLRDRYVKFFLGLALLGVLMALGGHTPFYKIPYHLFPLLKKFRAPGMIFFITSFSLCVLAGFGIQFIIEKFKEAQNRKFVRGLIVAGAVVGVLGLVCTLARDSVASGLRGLVESTLNAQYGSGGAQQKLAAFDNNLPAFIKGLWLAVGFVLANFLLLFLVARKKITAPVWAGVAGVLLLVDLWTVDAKFIQTVEPPRDYYPEDEVVTALKTDPGIFRVFPFQIQGMDIYRNDDYLMLFNIQSVGGYHGNQLNRYQEFIGAKNTIMFQNPENLYRRNFLDLLNVKYVIGPRLPDDLSRYDERTRQTIGALKAYFGQPNFQTAWLGRQYALYQNTTALDRAFLVPRDTVMNENDILNRLKDPAFDPRQQVMLEEKPEVALPAALGTDPVGTCRITGYDPNRITVNATLRAPAILVLSENYYPAWKAFVDGRPAKIYRADYLFRAVYLQPGNHTVEFVFRSNHYRLGGLASIFATLAIVTVVVIALIPRRKRGGAPPPASSSRTP